MLIKKVMFLLDSHMDGVTDQSIVELEQVRKIFRVREKGRKGGG